MTLLPMTSIKKSTPSTSSYVPSKLAATNVRANPATVLTTSLVPVVPMVLLAALRPLATQFVTTVTKKVIIKLTVAPANVMAPLLSALPATLVLLGLHRPLSPTHSPTTLLAPDPYIRSINLHIIIHLCMLCPLNRIFNTQRVKTSATSLLSPA
jgi:hypothetical protein